MYARVATFEGYDPDKGREIVDLLRDRLGGLLQSLPGWEGGMTLVSLEANRAVAIHVFDTRENMDAAEPTFETMPQRLGEDFARLIGGRRVTVERFWVVAGLVPGGEFWASQP
jgi:hypothetical protein